MTTLHFPTKAASLSGPVAGTEFVSMLRWVLEQAYTSRRKTPEVPRNIGIAVSGGIDSMALARLAHKLSSFDNEFLKTEFRAMIVDHMLRPESTTEAESVRKTMEDLGFTTSLLTVPAYAFFDLPKKSNLEAIARRQRYRLFARACQQYGISHLVTAHHANDQAETVLMRIVKGSGTAGLAGMSPVARLPECEDIYGADDIVLLRPFLGVMKNRLRETLTAENIPWHEDPTNSDTRLTPRNAIRAFFSPPMSHNAESKSNPPAPTPISLPPAITPTSLLTLSSKIAASNAKTQELVDWYLSRCTLRHIQASNVIEAFIPLNLLSMPIKLLTRVLARLASVISPLERIDLVQMSKVAKNIMETTDPLGEDYLYVNHANSNTDVVAPHDSDGGSSGDDGKPKKQKRKDFRPDMGPAVYYHGAITENNIYWEAVYCKPYGKRPEGVLLLCYRQPYIRKSAKRKTDTPEVNIDPYEPEKWYLFDGRFWLRYSGPTGDEDTFWGALRSGKAKRIFITGTRKEVMYRAETDGISYAECTDVDGKKMLYKARSRWRSEAPGKSRTVLPVLCEEERKPTRLWKVPYRVLGFPTFGIGGDMMGQWDWKVKRELVVNGVTIGDVPVTAVDGKMVPL